MTAQKAGATPHGELNWHGINWEKVYRNVRRLQARIVKATQEGRWGKVSALQRLLTRSFSGKALAVRRVTENRGRKTAGADGEVWDNPGKKAKAVMGLKQRGYKAQPLRRVYIPKGKNKKKKRPLGIPAMKDRAMQALYQLALDPVAEVMADGNSYGFRSERSCADAIAQCFTTLSRSYSPQWISGGDIKSCYDRISHGWLIGNIPMEEAILKQWLKSGYMERGVFFHTREGVPQGGIISPVIANMTLDGLEAELKAKFASKDSRRQNKVNLIRYADDFIITGKSKEILTDEVKPLVERFLAERGLELSDEKTKITHIEDGFDFLGQNIRKYKGKLIIKPSKESIKTLLDKVREIIKRSWQSTVGKMIIKLNSVLRGWGYYHRHVVSKKVFNYVDDIIFKILRRWIKRRHPNKSKSWCRKKYYTTYKGDNWVFFGRIFDKDGGTSLSIS